MHSTNSGFEKSCYPDEFFIYVQLNFQLNRTDVSTFIPSFTNFSEIYRILLVSLKILKVTRKKIHTSSENTAQSAQYFRLEQKGTLTKNGHFRKEFFVHFPFPYCRTHENPSV